MNGKKLLSVILAVMMIMQVLPVFANNAGAATGAGIKAPSNVEYIVYDTFDAAEDTGTFELGAFDKTNEAQEVTLTQATLTEGDETIGALKFATSSAPAESPSKIVTAVTDFEDIAFAADKKIYIETRIKHKGNADGNGHSVLKYNRPNSTSQYADSLKYNSYN